MSNNSSSPCGDEYYSAAMVSLQETSTSPQFPAKDVYMGFIDRATAVSQASLPVKKTYHSPILQPNNPHRSNALPIPINSDIVREFEQDLQLTQDAITQYILPTINMAFTTIDILKEAGEKIQHQYTQAYNAQRYDFHSPDPDATVEQAVVNPPRKSTMITTLDDDISSPFLYIPVDTPPFSSYSPSSPVPPQTSAAGISQDMPILPQTNDSISDSIIPTQQLLSSTMHGLATGLHYCSAAAQALAHVSDRARQALEADHAVPTPRSPHDSSIGHMIPTQGENGLIHSNTNQPLTHDELYLSRTDTCMTHGGGMQDADSKYQSNTRLYSVIEPSPGSPSSHADPLSGTLESEASKNPPHASLQRSFWPSWVALPEPLAPNEILKQPTECGFCTWLRSIPLRIRDYVQAALHDDHHQQELPHCAHENSKSET